MKRRVGDDSIGVRQDVFIRALRTLPELSVYFGYFQRNSVWRPRVDGGQMVNVIDYKEKGSDVNLATMLLLDAYEGRCAMAAVVSNDSDLVAPIQAAKRMLPYGVVVLNPQPVETARKLRAVATSYQEIPEEAFSASVFPDTLTDRTGRTITKPESW